MLNEKILEYQAREYQTLSANVEKEYTECPWADNFVKSFAQWLQEVKVFTWKNSVIPESAQRNLDALKEMLPSTLAPEFLAKLRGKGDARVSLIGFLMGRALALAALDHEEGGLPSVTDLQYNWWSFPGFMSVITEDVKKNKENSRGYSLALQHIQWLQEHPEKGICGKREQQQFRRICESWRREGTLAGLWDNTFGWQYFPATEFEEIIISALLASEPDLILPQLNIIRIPTIMGNIFRDTVVQYDPDLLLKIIHNAPPCTDMDENLTADISAKMETPVWNGSIVAASILSFVVDYAQALLGKQQTEYTEDTHEVADFLNKCADSMIARRDGLYLAKYFVQKLHRDMCHLQRDNQSSTFFLDAIVSAVEKQKKNTLLMQWIKLEHKERMAYFRKEDWERFIEAGLQSKKQNDKALETLVAYARLLPVTDLQGETGGILREAYEYSFCTADTSFYTSEYSSKLPNPLHESLSWIFFSPDINNPAEKWEQTWNKLGAVTNRIFRDFFYKNKLDLMYVLNFHLAIGLAVADCTYTKHDTDNAKNVIHLLLKHLLDILRMNDRFADFYKEMVCILICKLYLYSCPTDENTEHQVILNELADRLHEVQSIPMLTYKSIETLFMNGLNVDDIKSCEKLKKITKEAYEMAREHDKNNHWKINGDEKIKRACDKMLSTLND